MQRVPWSGGRAGADAEAARRRQGSSKAQRSRQGGQRGGRRLGAPVTACVLATAGLALLLWGLSSQLGAFQRSGPGWRQTLGDRAKLRQEQLDALIARTEAERQRAVEQLQPAFQAWQALKGAAAEARQRLRESRADVSNMRELHDQRLNILPAAKEHSEQRVAFGSREASADTLRQEWGEELRSAEDGLTKASAEDADVMYRESRAHKAVEALRRDIQAMGAALTEFMQQRSAGGDAPVRGAAQPGNAFDRALLLRVFSRSLEGPERRRLGGDGQADSQAVLGSLEHPLDSAAAVPAEAGTEQLSAGKGLGSSGGGFEAAQEQQQQAQQQQQTQQEQAQQQQEQAQQQQQQGQQQQQAQAGAEAGGSQRVNLAQAAQEASAGTQAAATQAGEAEAGSHSGGSRAMLPDRAESAAESAAEGDAQKPGWLSARWADRGNGILGPQEADSSLRCESSGICEGAGACPPGAAPDSLGCVTQSAARQERVRSAARWAWDAYKAHAFGKDELLPLSQGAGTWFDLGLTLVDSLDTLLLLGLDAEYEEARAWVASELRVDPDKAVNLFETTIRVLGGLLSAFHLSGGDRLLLHKAAALALRLLPAFGSQSGIPFSDVNLRTHTAEQPQWTSFSSLSEVTSLSLELSYLARATGEREPADKALAVLRRVLQMPGQVDGLAPIFVDIQHGRLHGHVITLGARGDSYYEYLLKQWLLSGKREDALLRGYEAAMRGVRARLLLRSDADGLLFVGEMTAQGQRIAKMDHLVCFLPGLLALGHHHGINTAAPGEPDDLEVAEELMRTCYELYRRTPTGLAPEIAFFVTSETTDSVPLVQNDAGGGDFVIKPTDAHNLLRPETVESLFVLWRVSGKPHLREWAWQIFRAFEAHARVEAGGYANLDSCLEVPAPMRDKMESFWLAETLKYLYLILDDSQPQLVSLDEFVFNTEAHPLPVEGSLADIAAGGSYEHAAYGGRTNLSLDARIQHWEQLAAAEAAKATLSVA